MSSGPQSPSHTIDLVGPMTVTHVVLMAALALAAILAIWWGTVLRRRSAEAEQQMAEDFAVAEEHGATIPATVQGMDESPVDHAPAPVPATPEALPVANDLTTIKGLGPKLATTLGEHGITSVAQIAALTPHAAAELDAKLGTFKGRMERDRWIEQAKLLSAGDRAAYEAAFGKLGG